MMHDVLHKAIPEGPVGESWEVSAHPHGLSRVANGALSGSTLAEVIDVWNADLLGTVAVERRETSFPLLVKFLDVNTLTSVQVHPSDEQARELEGVPRGKTEAWYIMHAAPTARCYVGFRPGVTAGQYKKAVESGHVARLLQPVELKRGSCIFVPPGTVHALGDGVLMLEIQQDSDITYRVYDWDRTDGAGRKRELHIAKAARVIDFGARPRSYTAACEADRACPILDCDYFSLYETVIHSTWQLGRRSSFAAGTVVDGDAAIHWEGGSLSCSTGDSVVIPAELSVTVSSDDATIVWSMLEKAVL